MESDSRQLLNAVKCQYFHHGTCDLASSLSGITCATTDKACEVCSNSEQPQTENAVTYSLAYSTLQRKKLFDSNTHAHVYEGVKHFCTLKKITPIELNAPLSGVGTRLASMLSFLKKDISTCGTCRFRVQLMNRWGPKLCREKHSIIMNWLKESAERNGYIFVPAAISVLIYSAIILEEKLPS